MRVAPRLSLFVAAACACALARLAHADGAVGVAPSEASAEQKREATAHFAAGKEALAGGDLARAAAEFESSIEVVDSPNARLELARTLRDAGELERAWEEYRRTAQDAFTLSANETRYAKTAEAAASERAELEKRIALVTVTVVEPPAGAMLRVAGKAVPEASWKQPLFVPAGPVEVALFDAGGAPLVRTTLNAALGQTTPVSIEANVWRAAAPVAASSSTDDADLSPSSAAPTEPAPLPLAPTGGRWMRPLGFVAAGVGALGLGTFTAFGVVSNGIYSELKSACPHGCAPDKRGEIDSGILDQTIANVGLAVGIAGVAVSATSFILSATRKPSGSGAALVIGPGYLGVRGSL